MNNDQLPNEPSQVPEEPTPTPPEMPVAPPPVVTPPEVVPPQQPQPQQPQQQKQPQPQPPQQPQPQVTTDQPVSPDPVEPPIADDVSVSWSAMEDIPKNRPKIWYVGFAIIVLGLLAVAIFVFRSWTFSILVPVMAAAVLTLAFKPGNPVHHTISTKGVYVGDKLHDYSEFRAFGVMLDHDHNSVMLLPVKRFSPGIVLYFDEQYGERIVDILGAHLPMQEIKPDAIERFVRFIRL